MGEVAGSIPARPLFIFFGAPARFVTTPCDVVMSVVDVPVAQLDKASDYESEDWGFKSLQGY